MPLAGVRDISRSRKCSEQSLDCISLHAAIFALALVCFPAPFALAKRPWQGEPQRSEIPKDLCGSAWLCQFASVVCFRMRCAQAKVNEKLYAAASLIRVVYLGLTMPHPPSTTDKTIQRNNFRLSCLWQESAISQGAGSAPNSPLIAFRCMQRYVLWHWFVFLLHLPLPSDLGKVSRRDQRYRRTCAEVLGYVILPVLCVSSRDLCAS